MKSLSTMHVGISRHTKNSLKPLKTRAQSLRLLFFQSAFVFIRVFDPLTPMSDQDRISPYNINTVSTRYQPNINLGIIS